MNNNNLNDNINNFQPMIPSSFEKHSKKIIYPAYLQPKLDGFRMYAMYINNELKLLSRQNKEIFHLNHLKNDIEKILAKNKNYILDGELTIDGLCLHDLKSILFKKTIEDNNKILKIKYNIFDLIDNNNFGLKFFERLKVIKSIVKKSLNILLVKTF